jgi:hypothetical protein
MKLVSRHFSGAQNLEVARTSWENIWNVGVNMSHMRRSRIFMDPEINSLPTQIKGCNTARKHSLSQSDGNHD